MLFDFAHRQVERLLRSSQTAMLLSVYDLVGQNAISSNCIEQSDALVAAFRSNTAQIMPAPVKLISSAKTALMKANN
jgi:hypothetical protein